MILTKNYIVSILYKESNKFRFIELDKLEFGEVIYCGYTIAGRDYTDNTVEFKFRPENLFDVYANKQGEFRHLSIDSDEHGTFGSNPIYESIFENNHISYKPVFAMVHSGDDYGYWTEDTWDDWGNSVLRKGKGRKRDGKMGSMEGLSQV